MGGVFLCYRREHSAHAGRLYDWLKARLGPHRLFRDIDSISPGVDFSEALLGALRSCDTLIAVIGPGWAQLQDRDGLSRLYDPHDYVRLEIAAAFSQDLQVIPVLVDGSSMPEAWDLPKDLAPLSRCQALRLTDQHWNHGAQLLLRSLKGGVPQPTSPTALSEAARTIGPFKHDSKVFLASLSPGGRTLVTATQQAAYIWSVVPHIRLQKTIAFKGRGLVGAIVSIFSEEYLQPLSAAITSSGKTLALVERGLVQEGTIKILDVPTGRETKTLTYGGSVRDLAFSHDGRYLAAGGAGDALSAAVWDYKTQEYRISEVGHIDQKKLRQLDRAHTRQMLIHMGAKSKVSTAKRTGDQALLKVVQLEEKQALDAFNDAARKLHDYGNQGTITSVAFDRGGTWMLTSGVDKTVRLWNVKGRREVDQHTFSTVAQHVALSPDGLQLAAARATVIELRPIESKSAIAKVECASRPLDLCFNDEKKLLIVTHTRDNSVWVWTMPNPAFD